MSVLARLEYPYISGEHGPAHILDIAENSERYGFLPAARYTLRLVGDVFSKHGIFLLRKTLQDFSNAAETAPGLPIIMTVS